MALATLARTPAHGVTPRRPLFDRLALLLAAGHSRRMLARLVRSARTATATQHALLLEKIRRNRASEFGRNHGFGRIRNYTDFVRQVPVTRYEDLEPYVERVKAGHVRAMFGPHQKVHMFAKTSGTTDRPKYVPVTTSFLKEYRAGWNAFGVKVIHDHACFLRPIIQVTSPMDEERSSGGFPCGAITGLMAANQQRLVRRYYVVPMDAAYVTDAEARYYCVMRFAVPVADVAFLVTASPATQLRLARTADQHAEPLIRDVHDGTISAKMAIPQDLRRRLEARLRPDHRSARRLENLLRHTGRLLPKDYWNLAFLANWTGGTMGLYLRDFPEYFGDAPVRDIGLLASEGRMSIPIEDGTPSGILNVADNFFEFIPAEEYESAHPTVLRPHDVEEGREYFILLTTSAGFYRYDIGDRIRVTGFFEQAPMIEFLHKGLHTSSLTGEKLTEQQVVMAFDTVAGMFKLKGRDFVLAPRWSASPFYRLHLETADEVDEAAGRRLVEEFERRLQSINIEYASKRASGRLAPVRLNLLPANWLAQYDQRIAVRQRASNEQYKHRYLLSEIDADGEFPTAPVARPEAGMPAESPHP